MCHSCSLKVFFVCSSSGSGEAGPGCRHRLPLREGAADSPELHPPAHPHPALHLRGRWLERLLLVHGARSRQSGGTTLTHTLLQEVFWSEARRFSGNAPRSDVAPALCGASSPVWHSVCLHQLSARQLLSARRTWWWMLRSLTISHWSWWKSIGGWYPL